MCLPVNKCSNLVDLEHGSIHYSSGSSFNRPIGTTATYVCDPGYTINEKTVKICQSNGTWNDSSLNPSCAGIVAVQ